MNAIIEYMGNSYAVNFNEPKDISLAMFSGNNNPNAFGIQAPTFEPIVVGNFVGSVAKGGSVNCENLFINAHGNGTHTECVGHISKERITINQCLKHFMFMAQLITVDTGQNLEISATQVMPHLQPNVDALIIRTLPNTDAKKTAVYSGNNPAYLSADLCKQLAQIGIKHLVIDLPSVDPELDEGKLSAHHAFWQYPSYPRLDATITEMAYINNQITDGIYLLNLQIASLETDASMSKPVLYNLKHVL